jgi:hypothetical protein
MLRTAASLATLWRNVMRTPLRFTAFAGCGMIGAFLASGSVFADGAPSPTPSDPGVWQKHQYSFAFMGFTSTYSCDGLASKLKILLIASGARSDAKASPGACASGFGRPDKFARANLMFYTLAAANSDKPAERPAVDGVWRSVALRARNPRELATGDCELVEQFKTNVLAMFTTRNITSRTTCIPHQESGSVIDLKFESFSAPPRKHDTQHPPVNPAS